MSTSKSRMRAEITRLKIAIAALGPVVAASEELRDASDWADHATCEAEADQACAALDAAIDALCLAVDARRAGTTMPDAAGDHLLAGFVPDAPAQDDGDVAAFLSEYEWPGDAGAWVCRGCGCTDDRACVGADGQPCSWAAVDLCSACVEREAA